MDSRTGDIYPTKGAALTAGVEDSDIVEIGGSRRAIRRVRMAVKAAKVRRDRAAKRRQQKASRRANR